MDDMGDSTPPRNFLIMGLPRSRTTWLSRFFTTKGVFCWHDLAGYCLTLDEMVEAMSGINHGHGVADAEVVGSSCSGQVLVLDSLLERLPRKPRIVYIRRPVEDCIASFSRVTGVPGNDLRPVFQQLDTALDEAEKRHPGMRVRYESLDGPMTVVWLWRYVTGHLPFPTEHYSRIRLQNIQPEPELLRRAARNGHDCVVSRLYETLKPTHVEPASPILAS